MGGGGGSTLYPFRREIDRWVAVGGGIDEDGKVVEAPWELTKARFIDNLCQRYSCLPSQLLNEDLDNIMKTLAIVQLAEGKDDNRVSPNSVEDMLGNMSTSL
jgi:hypothetical protein